MFKIIDKYTIKTFFGPFIFIFSVLFFIFIVNIVWIRLESLVGKGLSALQILRLLYYLGMGVVSLVLPLTILLASIMTFGGLGERYELAAIKASGGSLLRIMTPLFWVSVGFSIILFFFSNSLIPDFQRKAKNMGSNIKNISPKLIFSEGEFNNTLDDFTVKFDKFLDEEGRYVEGVFIRKKANSYQSQQSIIARKGRFLDAENINYLKLELYNGYINDENIENIKYSDRPKQPDQSIKFDTLSYLIDVSKFVKENIDKEEITDDYQFENYTELNKTIEEEKNNSQKVLDDISHQVLTEANSYINYIEKNPKTDKKIETKFSLDSLNKEQKLNMLTLAYHKLENIKKSSMDKHDDYNPMHKNFSRIVMYQQRMLSLSVTAVIFFLIGASLGSIIRKGGVGLPVIFSIFIYIIFYTMNLTVENLSWSGSLNPYIGVWLPDIVLFIFSIWLTYKAINDSQLFDMDKYIKILQPVIRLFSKKKEHKRYQ